VVLSSPNLHAIQMTRTCCSLDRDHNCAVAYRRDAATHCAASQLSWLCCTLLAQTRPEMVRHHGVRPAWCADIKMMIIITIVQSGTDPLQKMGMPGGLTLDIRRASQLTGTWS
jgi:hypothetical protein